MPDGSALLIDVGLSTAKLERDADRIVAKMTRSGQAIDGAWVNATRGIDNTFKKAASSASVFEREIAKTDRQVENLRKSIDPLYAATRRLESQEKLLNRAFQQGSINAKTYESTLSLIRSEYDLASAAANRMAGSVGRVGAVSRAGTARIQNASFQIADFATQVGSGTSASIALGQQLPQLLGGFGALGAGLGAIVAIGVPLTTFLLSMGDASDELAEDTQTLVEAVNDYVTAAQNASLPTEQLAEKYGTASVAARNFAEALKEIEFSDATAALATDIDLLVGQIGAFDEAIGRTFEGSIAAFLQQTQLVADLRSELLDATNDTDRQTILIDLQEAEAARSAIGEYIGALEGLRAEYKLNEREAARLADAALALANADTVQDQVEAANALQVVLRDVFGIYDDMPEAIQKVYNETIALGEAAAEVQGAIENSTGAVFDLSAAVSVAADGLGIAAGQAGNLFANLQAAAGAAYEAASALAQVRAERIAAGPDGAVQEVREDFFNGTGIRQDDVVSQSFRPARAPSGGGGSSRAGSSGGGRGGSGGQAQPSIFASLEQDTLALERQLEALGQTDQEITRLTARYELLDLARERGLDLDARSTETGRTLREEIDAQAEAFANLTSEVDQREEALDRLNAGISEIADTLAGVALGTESLADAFRSMLAQMAQDLISSGLEQLIGNAFGGIAGGAGGGGGNLLGSLLGFEGGGFTGTGSRTGGVDGRGGFPAILHPNETVIDHTRPQAASSGGVISIAVTASSDFEAMVTENSTGAAVQVVSQYDQSTLPGRIGQRNADPRRIG